VVDEVFREISHLRGTAAGTGANGHTYLTGGGSHPTVFDDGAADLFRDTEVQDWFFAHLAM
jgi:hypothetical protein